MDLVALEEIRRLKYRYLRCVDLKLWDEFAEVFTEDAVAEYDTPVLGETLRLEGRDAIVEYMRSNLGPDKISTHAAGCPEIDLDGDSVTVKHHAWFEEAWEVRLMLQDSDFFPAKTPAPSLS